MQKFLTWMILTASLALCSAQDGVEKKPSPVAIDYSDKAPAGWSCTALPILRCPAPASWKNQDGWTLLTLKNENEKTCYLDVPTGRVNDILAARMQHMAIISLQPSRAEFIIYIVSWKEHKVWAVDISPLEKIIGDRAPDADPQDNYAFSPFQFIGLRLEGNTIQGLVRHASAVHPQERGLSMLIRFSIDLNAPKPLDGQPWPLTVTQVEDSGKEREWNPGNRDFNPPFVKQK